MKAILTAAAMLAFCVMYSATGYTHSYKIGDLEIVHPWARPSLKGVPNGAAYMAIANSGDADDVLVSVSSSIARHVELHTMEMRDGVMRMRQIEGGVKVPARDTVALEPGGMHIMLIGLQEPIEAGSRFDLMLTFEKAGQHTVEVMVQDSASHSHESGS